MSEEDYSAIELEDTTTPFVKSAKANSSRFSKKVKKIKTSDDEETDAESNSPLLRRLSSVQSALRPRFGRFRNSFRKLNCFKNKEEEVVPMMEIPRHKSIDITVGLARRVSLFLFTRRTVCVHPYHPFTPEQTTRKLYFCFEDKYLEKKLSTRKHKK